MYRFLWFNIHRLSNLYCEYLARVHMAKDARACECGEARASPPYERGSYSLQYKFNNQLLQLCTARTALSGSVIRSVKIG